MSNSISIKSKSKGNKEEVCLKLSPETTQAETQVVEKKPAVGDTVYLPKHKTVVTIGTLYLDDTHRVKDTTGDLWLVVSALNHKSKSIKHQADWVAVL